MKWNKITIETTTAAEDMLSYELQEMGIEGVEVEDHVPLSEEDRKIMYVDLLPDEIAPDDGTARISCYIDEQEDLDEMLDKIRAKIEELSAFLPMGTGSGILSIIGLKLGARHAMATDIDPNAIRATEENFAINGVAGQAEVHRVNILDETEAREFYENNHGKRYDVIVANILADVIIPLSGIVTPLLTDDGVFITSGIINTMEEAVKEAMLANNFEILEIHHMKDWVSITAKPKK